MLRNASHENTIFNTIFDAVKTPPEETTPDTVVQLICKDGEIVTTDRVLLMYLSPVLRSIMSSITSSGAVISLPDDDSAGLKSVLKMLSQRWSGEFTMLTEEQMDVVTILGIPVGQVEKVRVMEFDMNDIEADNTSSQEEFNIKCPVCNLDCGIASDDAKNELYIHIGEIHSEPELLAEYRKAFPNNCNSCQFCGEKVHGDYVQKEHILLQHPWPTLSAMVGEAFEKGAEGGHAVDGGDSKQHYDDNNQDSKSRIYTKPKSKRGRKRKNESSDTPVQFPLFVPQRKSAKRASVSISKSFEGQKKYKQQDIGMFVKKVETTREGDAETTDDDNNQLNKSQVNNTLELMENVEKLLKDSDEEEEKLGLDITYDNTSDIVEIQDNIEFSDSDSDSGEDIRKADYSIKVENDSDLLEIQQGIVFSDSDDSV